MQSSPNKWLRGDSIRRYSLGQSLLLILPLAVLLGVFYFYPLLALIPESLYQDGGLTLEHYRHFFIEPLYTLVLKRTIRMGLYVTAICFVLGYPVSYLLSKIRGPRLLSGLMALILLPFFTSILVRSYAWIVLFQSTGVINTALLALGVIEKPLELLYTETAVLVGMSHIMLPFMILPVYSVLRNIDRNLILAARNLGSTPFGAFMKVTFPLSLPGVGAGVMFVFILSLGFYITPALLGGPKTLLISTLIDMQVNRLMQWDFASAIVVVLLAVTGFLIVAFDRLIGLDKIGGE